jgi:type IV fimbrial biogenesis protein FimT
MKTAQTTLQSSGNWVKGFTLVEVTAALALVAVIVAFAAPSFASMARRHRVDALKDSFIGSIQLARTEAIRLGEPVVLRRREPCSGATSNGDWRCGWLMFADPNGNQRFDDSESLLLTSRVPAGTVLRKAGAVNPGALAIDRFGQVTQAGTRLEIYPEGKDFTATDGLLICFPSGSRIRTVKAAAKC